MLGLKGLNRSYNLSILWQTNFLFDLQEHFLVPDHTITDITGASFAGFYYVCLQKSAATIEGYYYHRSSEWLVQLFLCSYCAWQCIYSCILDNEKTETQLVKAFQKEAFYFFIPRKFTFKTQLDVSRIFQTHFQACLFMGLDIALFLLDFALWSVQINCAILWTNEMQNHN